MEEGEAAFYGPKLDFIIRDALKREWQISTVQVDYNLPERFELEYVGEDNERHRPIMIHRALYGSMERFVAVMIEHYAGAFPAWLTPVQVALIPVADRHLDYARQVADELHQHGLRVKVDDLGWAHGREDPRGDDAEDPVDAGDGRPGYSERRGQRAAALR